MVSLLKSRLPGLEVRDLSPTLDGLRLCIEQALVPLWWALALGACLGGNGTLIGASANLSWPGWPSARARTSAS